MQVNWDDTQPIYLQLRDKVLNMILEEVISEGEALPSVRNVSAEYKLNPITVSKAYQILVDNELVEKRRGLGMFVTIGAKAKLLTAEREQFLTVEWPALLRKIARLGILLDQLSAEPVSDKNNSKDEQNKYKKPLEEGATSSGGDHNG